MLFVLAIIKNDSTEEVTFGSLFVGLQKPEILELIFNNPNFRKALMLWLPFMDDRGFFSLHKIYILFYPS